MGEAKRRQDAAKKTVEVLDVRTGKMLQARYAGDPVQFLKNIAKLMRETMAGGRPESHVPCNGCRECCYHAGVDVDPSIEPPEHLKHLEIWQDENGAHWLKKGADGACVHLGPDGCTVYEHRPAACRSYDCRLYALTATLDSFDGGHAQPPWVFRPRSRESAALAAACAFLGMAAFVNSKRAGDPMSAAEVAAKVMSDRDKLIGVRNAILTIAKLSPEQQTAMLGIDPRSMTSEQMQAAMQRYLTGP